MVFERGWGQVRAWASVATSSAVLLFAALPAASGQSAVVARLRVGTSGDYAPFSSANARGERSGFDVELAERFAADTGARVEFVRFRWPELLGRLAAGAFDVAMSGVTIGPERALVGRYSRPYARTGAVLLIRDSDAERYPDIAAADRPGVRLVVNAGGHLERLARGRFRRASITAVSDNRSLPGRVLDQEADAAVSDSAEARSWLGRGLRVVGPFSTDHKAFLMPAENAALAHEIDAWMVAREADGWLGERRRQWLGETLHAAGASRAAVAAFVRLRLEIMPAVAAAKGQAGRSIEDAIQEGRVLARVRRMARKPELIEPVYRELIAMAKEVQRAELPAQSTASLAALRDAIGRIDEQLVREIERAPRTDRVTWQEVLGPVLAGLPIAAGRIEVLADSLSGSGRRFSESPSS